MRVLAIDPGTEQSGWVLWDSEAQEVVYHDILPNQRILDRLMSFAGGPADELVIEEIESFGMPVGREVFRTVFFCGRIAERWELQLDAKNTKAWLMSRRTVKIHHCGTSRGTDATVWQALVDRFGPPGSKSQPGKLFGIKSHTRSALALAVAFADVRSGRQPQPEARRA